MLSRKNTLRDSATGVADQIRPHVDEARKRAEPAIRDAAAKARAESTRVAAEARDRAQPLLEDARRNAGPALADARAKAEPAIRDAAKKAREEGSKAAQEARRKAAPALEEAKRKAAPAIDDARKRVAPALDEARGTAAPYIDEARKRVQPVVEDALEKAAPLASEARRRAEGIYDEKVLPGVATALTLADDATAEIRTEAGRRGSAAVAALKGDVEPPKKSSPLRKVLFAVGMAGVAGVVAKKLGDRQAAQAWESAYTSNPPKPAPTAASAPAGSEAATAGKHKADDTGGGNPGEAVADSSDVPHAASTPDAPADVVDVEDKSV